MVGSALACLISRFPDADQLDVAVVESTEPRPWLADEMDLRVSALSRASQRILSACETWDRIAAARVSVYREMHVWDERGSPRSFAAIQFEAAMVGEPDLGHIVENSLIQSALLEQLRRQRRVELMMPATLESVTSGTDAIELGLQDGRRLTARLLVVADGVQSTARRLLGIATRGWTYDQSGVVCHVRTEQHHGEAAWQRFLATGPIALLPLADGRCSIVWSTSAEHAEELLQLSSTEFDRAVSAASDRVLGSVLESSRRAVFPLQLLHAVEYTRPRVALIGDAAHGVHPLAGQGVNLGLLDAAALAEVIAEGLKEHREIGDASVLRRYERWRKGENLLMLGALDALHRLFQNPNVLVGGLRRVGLTAVDRLGPLKHRFVRQAMGLEGDLPRVARQVS